LKALLDSIRSKVGEEVESRKEYIELNRKEKWKRRRENRCVT
jgi:hypothetical protein